MPKLSSPFTKLISPYLSAFCLCFYGFSSLCFHPNMTQTTALDLLSCCLGSNTVSLCRAVGRWVPGECRMHGTGMHLLLPWDLCLVHESPNAPNFLNPGKKGLPVQHGLTPKPLLPSASPLLSASVLRVCLSRHGTALISWYQGTYRKGLQR